jgi:putative ABC transport system permease protein
VGAKPYRVVGVIDTDSRFLPTTSGFESQPVGVDERIDFWIPILMREDHMHREWRYNYRAIARLQTGVTMEQAQEELHRVCDHLAAEYPETNEGWTANAVPLEETIVGDVRSTIWLLLGAIGFLLLVALANVASLLLVRGVRRQHELTVRAALGADRRRLIGQLLTESLVLGLLSGVAGVGVALGGVVLLKGLAPPQLPRVDDVTIDGTVLSVAVLVSLLTGLMVGVIPAWLASRADSGSALNGSGRSRTTGRSSRLVLKGLAAGSVAIALVLLIGAGLLQQSLARVLRTELGFERQRLLTMQLSLPLAAHEWSWNTSFCHEVVEHVGTVTGVESVGAIRGLPTQETDFSIQFVVEGSPEVPDSERPKGMIRVIGPGYFETTGIPLIAGRYFVPADDEGEIGHTRYTIVNQAAADLFWPGESAVGKRLKGINEGLEWMEVVGVVGNVRYAGLTEPAEPEVYYPDALFPQTMYHLLVRTTLDPLPVARAIEHAIHEIERDVLVTKIHTMDHVVSDSVADRRFAAVLLTAFSAVAFVIAVVGNYGVIACLVAERKRELGIRLALGAEPNRILSMVLREELVVGLIGIGAGLLSALSGTRLLQSFLYGVEATDPATYAVTILLLACVTGVAAFIPAWRASRLNPMDVLRDE